MGMFEERHNERQILTLITWWLQSREVYTATVDLLNL